MYIQNMFINIYLYFFRNNLKFKNKTLRIYVSYSEILGINKKTTRTILTLFPTYSAYILMFIYTHYLPYVIRQTYIKIHMFKGNCRK